MTRATTSALALALTLGTVPALAEQHMPETAAQGFCQAGFELADLDNDGNLDRDEVAEMQRREFAALDADEDGTVLKSEYSDCRMQAAQQNEAYNPRTPDSFADMDIDDDGRVTAAEYRAATTTRIEQVTGDMTPDDYPLFVFLPEGAESAGMGTDELAARARLLFVRLDDNRDEVLTEEEYVDTAVVDTDISRTLSRDFETLDEDASGGISSEEYAKWGEVRTYEALDQAEAWGVEADAMADSQDPEASDGDARSAAAAEVGAPVVFYRFEQPF